MANRWSAGLSLLLLLSELCGTSGFIGLNGRAPSAFLSPGRTVDSSVTALSMARRRGRPRGPVRTIHEKPPMNNEIDYDELRVVALDPAGGKDEILGIMSKADALSTAKGRGGLDLILINVNSQPPVCKIADYSKYRYIEDKKKKEKAKKSKSTDTKEIKMSYKIDVHDYEVRKKNAAKFLAQGNRVKCSVLFRGREVQHDKLGFELLDKMADEMAKVCTMEGKPKREGRNLSCFFNPRAEVMKAVNDAKRAEEKEKKKKKNITLIDDKSTVGEVVAGSAASTATLLDEDLSINLSELGEDDEDESLDDLLGADALTDDLFA